MTARPRAKTKPRRRRSGSPAAAARRVPSTPAVLMGKALAIEYESAVDGVKYRHQFARSAKAQLFRTHDGHTLLVQPVKVRNEYIED